MKTVHEPVLLEEILSLLQVQSNDTCIDGTVGGGGHAEAILKVTAPAGRLLGLDWDGEAIERTQARLAPFGDRVVLVNANYRDVKRIAYENGFSAINAILIDLGLSLDQLQISGRGFTFLKDEPLDMRFSATEEVTAADILNSYTVESLTKVFRDYGDEPAAWKIANGIVAARKQHPFQTTFDLVDCIALHKKVDRRRSIHPATLVFQALRIAVNHEFDNIRGALGDMIELLDAGGRCAVITFHAGEDRIVKDFFRQETRHCLCPPERPLCDCNHKPVIRLVTRKPVEPSAREVAQNPRARSAKVRVIEKLS